MDIGGVWERTPSGTKVGVIAAILGFIVSITSHSETVTNGVVTSCSFTDFGALGLGVLTAAGAVAGFMANPKRHKNLRLSQTIIVGVSVVLIALAVIHVLRGFGVIGGKC